MGIQYRGSQFFIEGISAEKLAKKYGTPLYVYSQETFLSNFRKFKKAFRGLPVEICYALKANSNPALLRLLAKEGSGADIVSVGELQLARKAGISASRIVFTGVGKTEHEIREALHERVFMLNIESEQELDLADSIARKLKLKAPIGLRVNPDIDPGTHPYISTGLKRHKFGVPMSHAVELYEKAKKLKNLQILGIHMHLGSQISSVGPIVEGFGRILSLVDRLKKKGISIQTIDIGGGLSIAYAPGDPDIPAERLSAELRPLLRKRNFKLVLEPGRSIVGNAGVLLTQVLYTKKNDNHDFVIVDAGMNDLLRPSLYHAYHEIVPVQRNHRPNIVADIVGPVCETGDFLANDRTIEKPEPGEFLAVLNAGAYGYSMSSNYNIRPRPAEVLVNGSKSTLIRKRGA
jgi:diaminopimelate decarboxylase